MRQQGKVLALLLTALLCSMSGCLSLIAARETVENLRPEAFESLDYTKVEVAHTFNVVSFEEFTNRSTFLVDDSTTEVRIYFKASFSFSDTLPSDNTTRYVRATLTDADGNIAWEQDVSEDSSPLEERLSPNPRFAYGEWVLDVKARGWGESTFGTIQDNFNILVTVTNTCMQYPLVEECS